VPRALPLTRSSALTVWMALSHKGRGRNNNHRRRGALPNSYHLQLLPYSPISARQCLYMARIAASEISVSEVPASVDGSSFTR
jgi:hypothetical protein